MSERTNYGTIAEKIDYTKLDKKLDGLREQEPPKKRKSVGDCPESRCYLKPGTVFVTVGAEVRLKVSGRL